MIKVKGYQVSPTEVEEEIRKVPGVLDVSVIGIKGSLIRERIQKGTSLYICNLCNTVVNSKIEL